MPNPLHPIRPARWPRRGAAALLLAALGAVSCGGEADDGATTNEACEQSTLVAQCPPGSNPRLGVPAEEACADAVGGVLLDDEGVAVGNCVGPNICQVQCQWSSPCLCGVAEVTTDGVFCRECDAGVGCGNGVCDPGEDDATCPSDCGPECSPGELECGDQGALRECNLRGRWEQVACPVGEVCLLTEDGPGCGVEVVGTNNGTSNGTNNGTSNGTGPVNGRWLLGDAPMPELDDAARDGDGRVARAWGLQERSGDFSGLFFHPGGELYDLALLVNTRSAYGQHSGVYAAPTPTPEVYCLAAQACGAEASCEAGFEERGAGSRALSCRYGLYQEGRCGALDEEEASCVADAPPSARYPLPEGATWRLAGRSPSHRYVAMAGRGEDGGALALLDQGAAPTPDMAGGFVGAVRVPAPQGAYRPVFARGESVVFSADERVAVAMMSNTNNSNRPDALLVWDLEADAARLILPELVSVGSVVGMALSPGGRVLALSFRLAGGGHEVRLIDVESEARVVTLLNVANGGELGASVNNANPMLAFSPRGDLFAVGWGGEAPSNRLVEVWGLGDYSKRFELTTVRNRFRGLAFSPDGATLLTGEVELEGFTAGVSLWDMGDGSRLLSIAGQVPSGNDQYGYSPDGRFAWVLGQESGGDRPTEVQFFGP